MLCPSCTKDILLTHYGWNTDKQKYHLGKFTQQIAQGIQPDGVDSHQSTIDSEF